MSMEKGEITYGDVLNVFPYANQICVLEVTGQQILDALEWGAREGRSAANMRIPTARAESRSSTGERRKRDGHDYTKVVYYSLICMIKPKRSEDP